MDKTSKISIVLSISVLICISIQSVNSHGRLMKPPSRSSIWRLPEFNNRNPPKNFNDMELFCGGIHQKQNPGNECGVCGDPLDQSRPRRNEIGGMYYRGIITGKYKAGQTIEVEAEITASHKGFMEWRLCTDPTRENQDCFNKHLLQRVDGQGSKVFVDKTGPYKTTLRLPAGVRCKQCILQWNYRAANSWGNCNNGTSAVGCGPQESFRGCADIKIGQSVWYS